MSRSPHLIIGLALAAGALAATWHGRVPPPASAAAPDETATATVRRGSFVRTVRVTGTVEAVRSTTVIAPRLAGQTTNSLVLTRLIAGGSRVRTGDILVEFDRQDQIRAALDRRAEFLDLEQQIKKKRAEQTAARARDETELTLAEHDVDRARLEVLKNDLLPRIQAEKNTLALEQAQARLKQLGETFALKRKAAEADVRILEIRRDRAERAMRHAERNARLLTVSAPFAGLVVVKSAWKGGTMGELLEGEEVRSGVPIVDVVDPSLMQVRARINQADIGQIAVGQRARITLDAYPDLAFDGRVEVLSPLGVASSLTPKVRMFVAIVSIRGTHANLMPDLSAAVDVESERRDGGLLAPRDAVGLDGGQAWVRLKRGASFERQPVTLGPTSSDHAVIESGVAEGAVVARHVTGAR
jgi:HlyD family secretion protein